MATDNSLGEKMIAAVDLGSSKIALAVARVEGNNTQIIYYKAVPSSGIINSAVVNPRQAKKILGDLIMSAEEELNLKITRAVVGLPRCDVHQVDATGTLKREMPDDCITTEEVDAIKSMAQSQISESVNPSKEKMYSVIAQSFSTEDYIQLIENDIVGMTGEELSGHFKVFLGKKAPIVNLTKIFNDLGIAIARTYFSPLATAKAVLTEEETSNGVALIDLGAGATSISIFEKKVLVDYAAIPFGGNTITGDIRTECGISESLADNIKKAFGGCMPDRLLTLGEKTIQIETNDMSAYKQILVKYLSEIITTRMKEIIDAMLYEIQTSGLSMDLRKGIVITGGGAEMLNISNYIKDLSGYNVRIGYPRHGFMATGCEDILKTDAATIAGLLLLSRDENINCCLYDEDAEHPAETPVERPEEVDPADVDEPVNDGVPGDNSGEESGEDSGAVSGEDSGSVSGEVPGAVSDGQVRHTKKAGDPGKKKEEKPEKPKKPSLWDRFKVVVKGINEEINNQEA